MEESFPRPSVRVPRHRATTQNRARGFDRSGEQPEVAETLRRTKFRILAAGVTTALAIRLFLTVQPGFVGDLLIFRGWALRLASEHPWHFYDSISSSDYAPGYLYILWFFGELDRFLHLDEAQWNVLLKTPSICADMASAWLIYRLLDGQGTRTQVGATFVYLFFPPAILIGSFWGQVDSIAAFFLLSTVYFLGRDRPVLGAGAFTLGFLVKPQVLAALPFLIFWVLRSRPLRGADGIPRGARVWIECAAISTLLLLVLIAPFFEDEPWRFLATLQNASSVDRYSVNSFGAFNFWTIGGVFKLGLQCDLPGHCTTGTTASSFIGIPTRYWGLGMFGLAIAGIVYQLRGGRDLGSLAIGTSLSMMAFDLLLTRMHERYLYAAFLPLLLACALLRSRFLWTALAVTASLHFANLYYVFGGNYLFDPRERWRYPDYLRLTWLFEVLTGTFTLPVIGEIEYAQIFSILMVATFVAVLAFAGLNIGKAPPVPRRDGEDRVPSMGSS